MPNEMKENRYSNNKNIHNYRRRKSSRYNKSPDSTKQKDSLSQENIIMANNNNNNKAHTHTHTKIFLII